MKGLCVHICMILYQTMEWPDRVTDMFGKEIPAIFLCITLDSGPVITSNNIKSFFPSSVLCHYEPKVLFLKGEGRPKTEATMFAQTWGGKQMQK